MKKLLLLAAIIYVLPKEKPLFDGMIIRCDKPSGIQSFQWQSLTSSKTITGNAISEQMGCQWECEFGEDIGTRVENGNKVAYQIGCKSVHDSIRINPSQGSIWL